VRHRWISEAELDANPGLVRSMSVQPPRGLGRVRVLEIEGVDLQPCGGTHVANTAEIGAVVVSPRSRRRARSGRPVARGVGRPGATAAAHLSFSPSAGTPGNSQCSGYPHQ
jgi:alanyl-tRNA synthetase